MNNLIDILNPGADEVVFEEYMQLDPHATGKEPLTLGPGASALARAARVNGLFLTVTTRRDRVSVTSVVRVWRKPT